MDDKQTISHGYANYIMEFKREQLGLSPDDDSKDDEIIKDLQRGEKLSKSKHMK